MPRRWGVAHLADPKHVVIAEAQLVKSLADLKRRLVPGAQVRLTWHRFAHRATAPDFIGSLRTVCRAQTQRVAFSREGNPELSWLTYPRAADLRIDGPDAFTILHDGEPHMSYVFEPSQPHPV